MKKFVAELEKLLDKYPSLGGFTLHINPRVKIVLDNQQVIPTIPDPVINQDLRQHVVRPDIKPFLVPTTPPVAVADTKKDLDPANYAKMLEKGVSKKMVEDLAKLGSQ